ncbi:MAG: ABC transporter permease [Saprospiraceae bacterium]|nr:ABC transporter permease [Saprospiraceae bacterium]
MIKNNLKIALRNLSKDMLSTSISLLGLSLGLACCILSLAFILHETSYDRFHADFEKIFRVTSKFKILDLSSTPNLLAAALRDEFGEVTTSIRLREADIVVEKNADYVKERTIIVDSNFFTFFSFPLVAGNPNTALAEPSGVVLSQKMANKYFGNKNALGKTLHINVEGEVKTFQVTGVASPVPNNSTIQFDFAIPWKAVYDSNDEAWMDYASVTFVKLTQAQAVMALHNKMPSFIKKYMGEAIAAEKDEPSNYDFVFQPLKDQHFYGPEATSEVRYLYILGGIGLLILLIACFNFMNFANAQSSGRSKEVGIRKVVGANKRQLVGLFQLEAIFTSLLALLLAIGMVELAVPYVGALLGADLTISYFDNWLISLSLPILAIITGLLAGSYPAVLLSNVRVVDAFKNTFKIGGYNWFTRVSIGLQFFISIGLIACTLVMWQQQRFIQEYNLGFDQEEIVVLPLQPNEQGQGRTLLDRLKNELAQYPAIRSISGVSNSFTKGSSASMISKEDGSRAMIFQYYVDPNYIQTMGMELLEGRDFDASLAQDTAASVIVNEAFVKTFEIEKPLGHLIGRGFAGIKDPQIIGIVKDFHFDGLQNQIQPAILNMHPTADYGYALVKIAPENASATLKMLENTYRTINPQKPFEFSFLDEDLQKQYETEARWSKAISSAALFAIIIACLGLLGLMALVAVRRTKEIGIRKVLGASVANIVVLLSREFLRIVLITGAIAVPAAWWAMSKWLEDFAYRIELQWWVFAIAGISALLIALITLSFQAIRAAVANPVNALKNE